MPSTKKIAYKIGVDEGEHEATEEADVGDVVVEDDPGRLGVKDRNVLDCGSPPGALPGSGSGCGSGANSTGSPDGPIMNDGSSHWGGNTNSVSHPNIDLNIASIPDPHPFRVGSSGLPPRPDTTMP